VSGHPIYKDKVTEMGQEERRRENKKDAGKARTRRRVASEPADWAAADTELIMDLIVTVTGQGGAIRFGYTSDGGAYAIGLYGDGDPYTEYIRPSEDLNTALKDILTAWNPG
jgi:hypothetical protein